MLTDSTLVLHQRLAQATASVTVVGAGYVGLPLALALARRGYRVQVLDVDPFKVDALNAGRSYIRDIPDGAVQETLAAGRFAATTEPAVIAASDVVCICVPTPFTAQKEPDTTHIAAAARQVAAHLRPGCLVILRSTSYPGMTEEIVRPALEAAGLRVGQDVFLAFAPERRRTLSHLPPMLDDCFRIPQDVVFQEVGGETVLLNVTSGVYYGLDPVGSRIWKLLAEKEGRLQAVFEAMLEEYDVNPERLEEDLLRLIRDLQANGLAEVIQEVVPQEAGLTALLSYLSTLVRLASWRGRWFWT